MLSTHDRPRGSATPSLPSLTGVRGVAAFAVFVSHMRYVFPGGAGDAGDAGGNLTRVLNWGAYGVTLFFILSGFVLAWTWADSTGPRTYARRRVARVWPVHAVVWAAFVVTALVGAAPRPDAGAAAATLVLVQCWIPGRGWADAVNPVAWTLSCEAFFYLVFPFVVGPIRRLGARGLLLAAGAVAAFGAATVIGLLEPRGIRVSSFPPFRIWEFLLGVIAGTAMRSGYLRRSLPVPVSLMLLVGAMAAGTWERRLRGASSVAITVGCLLVVCALAAHDLGAVDLAAIDPSAAAAARPLRWLASDLAQWAGERSYAFYLVQLLPVTILKWLGMASSSWRASILEIAGWLALTVLAAMALHTYVEKPTVARFRYARAR